MDVGLFVTVGVGVFLSVIVGLEGVVGVAVSMGNSDFDVGLGEIKIILIAPSSGTGESIFLPETRVPTITAKSNTKPTIKVTAASVRRRSSMLRV